MNDRHQRTGPLHGPTIFGYDPDGNPVHDLECLPGIHNFDSVVVGEYHIQINGWLFPYKNISKGVLQWMHKHMVAWSTDFERKEWMSEITETFRQRLTGEFQK